MSMNFDLQKKRFQVVLFVVAYICLSITADKCRHMVGKKAQSKSGQFTLLHCLDGGVGTLVCSGRESAKYYFNSIKSAHIEIAKNLAVENAINDALTQGLAAKEATKHAEKEGKKAAKLATRQVKRILGPLVSSGWDFIETMYFKGSLAEGFLRGSGTVVGTYLGGFLGEEKFGRVGYLVGSQIGSWVGGKIGLMVYDVMNGIHFLVGAGEVEIISVE